MPWSPSFEQARPDPGLDAVRGRAAQLVLEGEVRGHVLVETDYSSERQGGFLWWRRWADPAEFAVVLTRIGDAPTDERWITPQDFGLFETWSDSGFDDGGRVFSVVWLDEAESRRVHDEVFEHQH